jgi:hypothetical protein
MAVNLLEENRLVYHDEDVDTLEVYLLHNDNLYFENTSGDDSIAVVVNQGAVETLRDALTCWLETGKLK